MGVKEAVASLSENPYFGAGAGLFGVGALAAVSRKLLQYGNIFFRRHFMMSLEVTSRDKSYDWLLNWISSHAKKTQHLSVETSFMQSESGAIHTQYTFVPSVGDHYIRYGSTWIKVERHRETRSALAAGTPWESVTLTAFGRNRLVYFKILDAARELALKNEQGRTPIYVAKGSSWERFGLPRRKRPIESVILDRDLSLKILEDVREFINNSQWYFNRGIPYRRGYLLYGPPGCGKTSFITALAGELDYSISILNLGDIGMTDDRLNYLLTQAPQQSIILLEDIDAVFLNRDMAKQDRTRYEGMGRLTFSGLLNALDGVASSEARIVFMTTNHLERLDPALIRPGRIDLKQEVSYCTRDQLIKMFVRFYPESQPHQSAEFADRISQLKHPVAPALVQGYFMCHKNSAEKAVNCVKDLVQSPA